MLNAWHLPVAPFVKQNKDQLTITLWLAGENPPQRVTLRAENDNEEISLAMHKQRSQPQPGVTAWRAAIDLSSGQPRRRYSFKLLWLDRQLWFTPQGFSRFPPARLEQFAVDVPDNGPQWVADQGLSMQNVVAFGDNYNDLSMLEAAGTGVAMGNAVDDVKARANVVILGGGNVGTNACKIAVGMGANVTILDTDLEKLRMTFWRYDNRIQGIVSTALSVREQVLGEGRMNTPVSRLVRIGQRRALDFLAKPHVIKLGGLRRQADLDVAQAFAVSQLRKRHYAELLGAGHRLDVTIAVVAIDDAMKSLPGQKVHELGEQRLAEVHRRLRRKRSQKIASSEIRRSNRRHQKNLRMPRQYLVSSSWVSL